MAQPAALHKTQIEAAMSSTYFNTLNYTLANEDTSLERDILRPGCEHVLCVAGSGARVLPLFSRKPRKLTVVDLSHEQLLLTELRIEAVRQLSREDYLCFWGYPPRIVAPEFRKSLFVQLHVSAECRSFFESVFSANGYAPLLYSGRWERTFQKISKMCRLALGPTVGRLFEFEDAVDFRAYMAHEFPEMRWKALIFLIGNSTFFNTLLYRGSFPAKNTSGSHYSFYKSAYDRIFANGLPRQNFFLQLTFLGELQFAEGNPIECQPGIYEEIQEGIKSSNIEYCVGSVIDVVEHRQNEPIDFVSLSDVPSYFDEKTSRNFLQRMALGLSSDAVVVARYYLRVLQTVELNGFKRVNTEFEKSISAEKTQMYTMDVFKRRSL
jgi:S-adenosylmethionine-diacylglycerol 3-amino-3-carboxypropyl transferase